MEVGNEVCTSANIQRGSAEIIGVIFSRWHVSRWHILANPSKFWYHRDTDRVVQACEIVHKRIVECHDDEKWEQRTLSVPTPAMKSFQLGRAHIHSILITKLTLWEVLQTPLMIKRIKNILRNGIAKAVWQQFVRDHNDAILEDLEQFES